MINENENFFSDMNECHTDFPCHSNATCKNTDGSYICTCDSGYSGDGLNCTGRNTKISSDIKYEKKYWQFNPCKPSSHI